MSSGSGPVRVITLADGQAVAVKEAGDEAGRARLHREARMLAVARLPGVVEVIGLLDEERDGRARTELHTAFVSPTTLASHPPMPPQQAAAVIAALAETVAELHRLGMAHGAITPDHVLLASDGWPVLCSFGSARLLSEESPAPTSGEDRPSLPTPADDVAAIGSLLDHLLGSGADADPIPERRFSRPSAGHYHRRVLRTLADRATATEPGRRPTARALAASIQAAVPDAKPLRPPPSSASDFRRAEPKLGRPLPRRPHIDAPRAASESERPANLPARPAPQAPSLGARPDSAAAEPAAEPPRITTGRPRRGLAAAGALVGSTMLFLGGWSVRHGERPTLQTPPPPGPASTTHAPTTTMAESPADHDPDSAIDAPDAFPFVTLTDGTVQWNGQQFAVGAPGDFALIGAWRCDGQPLLALVRPSGAVFLFDRWATAGREVVAHSLGSVGSGGRVEGHVRGAGDASGSSSGELAPQGLRACAALVGTTASGQRIDFTIPAEPGGQPGPETAP